MVLFSSGFGVYLPPSVCSAPFVSSCPCRLPSFGFGGLRFVGRQLALRELGHFAASTLGQLIAPALAGERGSDLSAGFVRPAVCVCVCESMCVCVSVCGVPPLPFLCVCLCGLRGSFRLIAQQRLLVRAAPIATRAVWYGSVCRGFGARGGDGLFPGR